jgi:hypothetical protein
LQWKTTINHPSTLAKTVCISMFVENTLAQSLATADRLKEIWKII